MLRHRQPLSALIKANHANCSTMIIWLLLIVLLQNPCISSDSIDYEDQLQTAIEQAKNELEAEKIRILKELQIRRDELQQDRAECEKLSDEIVERKIAIAQNEVTLQQVRKQRETLWTERTEFQEDLAQIKSISREVQTELLELLDTLPVSENRKSQQQQLSVLSESLDKDAVEVMIPSVLELIESVINESRTSALYTADIIDPQGNRQNARMLRVGQSIYAYNINGTSRTALAISDPYQQGGFRWYEEISNEMRQAIIDAMNQAANRRGIYNLPVDVTGTMTAATDLSAKSIEGRFRSGGIVMFPLAILAVWLVFLIIERLFILLQESRHSLQFCEQILRFCSDGNFEKAEQFANKRKGIVSRILRICLANRHQPSTVLDDAIQEAFLHELPRLERFLPSMRMLSVIAPMLGLLGTVTGIIATFDMITVVGGGKPRLLAGGISEALITTATGLAIAIPGLLAHSILSSRIEGLIADAERFAASLSNILKQKQSESVSRREINQ